MTDARLHNARTRLILGDYFPRDITAAVDELIAAARADADVEIARLKAAARDVVAKRPYMTSEAWTALDALAVLAAEKK